MHDIWCIVEEDQGRRIEIVVPRTPSSSDNSRGSNGGGKESQMLERRIVEGKNSC